VDHVGHRKLKKKSLSSNPTSHKSIIIIKKRFEAGGWQYKTKPIFAWYNTS
jgi:hypothetical protein